MAIDPAEISYSSGGGSSETQQPTQSTEQASQPEDAAGIDPTLWGSLIPCSPTVSRFNFSKSQKRYRVGRCPDNTKIDVLLNGTKISWKHCTIEWDGDEGPHSAVKVMDLSSNGTFINGEKIGRGQSRLLREGNEIAFGTCLPQPKEGGVHDYRFVYRHKGYGEPITGLHKHYDLLHELGKGSYASVMKALHREDGLWYAVKIIQENKLPAEWRAAMAHGHPTTEESRRFLREITILKRLDHKNICKLKEVFVESFSICLVLEFVAGGDLLRHLLLKERQGKRLVESQVQHIVYQICDALAYVHQQGIAHRDLKLENVLLTMDDPPVVKVADFGLAKVVDTFTMLHTMCGTPVYLAPEVVGQGPEGYDQVVDSWSVGIITFITLTMNREPFLNDDLNADVKTRIQNRDINWALLRKRHISEEGEDFIHKLLERDPQKRMTLEDACHHPWLLACAPSEEPSLTPTTAKADNVDGSTRPEGSEVDVLAERMDATNPTVTDSDNEDCPTASALQRRADVISHARETGRLLPTPSQEMEERVAAAAAEEREAQTPLETAARAKKRKVADRSSSSLIPGESSRRPEGAKAGAVTTVEDDGKKKGRKDGGKSTSGTFRAPEVKRVRTRGTPPADAEDEEDEIPGLVLHRRSPRLNP
ncbi:kinase-like domain-containing protein [Trametes maxima]|nr:kinase-like domain-containing protein [Trametes maxima]